MKIRKNSRIAWGVTLITFGVMLYLRLYRAFLWQAKFINILLDFRNYPIYAGIIFLIFNKNKNPGMALLVVGILLRLSYEIDWVKNKTALLIWGALMVIIGILLIVQVHRNDANKDK